VRSSTRAQISQRRRAPLGCMCWLYPRRLWEKARALTAGQSLLGNLMQQLGTQLNGTGDADLHDEHPVGTRIGRASRQHLAEGLINRVALHHT